MVKGKAALSNNQKKEWAQVLFVRERMPQKDIAVKVGASENTISKWVNEGNWENLRKSLLVTKQEQLTRLYNQLDWTTKNIEGRKLKVANSAEADAILKLTAAINRLETETSLAEIIEVGQRFIGFVRTDDLETAQTITKLYDGFIQNELKQ